MTFFKVYIFILFIVMISLFSFKNDSLFLIIIPADLYYFNMVKNFYETIIILYRIKYFKIIATSTDMYKKCRINNLPVDLSPILVEENVSGNKIHTVGFAKKMRLKHPIFLKYLLQTKYLLALDADIYFFKHPITLLNYFNNSIDLLLACDSATCSVLNYGLMYNVLYNI